MTFIIRSCYLAEGPKKVAGGYARVGDAVQKCSNQM